MIRPATLADLDDLVLIENRCFETDRMSRRSFHHMISKGNAATLVAEEDRRVVGYVMVFFRRGTSMARIYSIAVLPEVRRSGVAGKLVEAAEQVTLDGDAVYMRLEVRTDNTASQELFKRLGYRPFGCYKDYYEDHADAVRMEKNLAPHLAPQMVSVPYYEQTLDFTCGPATLMMAMKTLDDGLPLNRQLELRLWRESTTIFMTSGHGGCGPYGLALSAYRRGFDVELFMSDAGALFVDSVRSEEKKEVIRLVHEDQLREIRESPITLEYRRLSVGEMIEKINAGGVPVILISSYRIYKEKFPHWVVVTGYDERFVYAHDPFVDYELGKTMTDCVNMPIHKKDFERMARYGKSGQRAALILYKRGARAQ